MTIQITSPSGKQEMCEVSRHSETVYRGVYNPSESGAYMVAALYGNIPIPSTPVRQTVNMLRLPDAYGEGLYKAEINKETEFTISSNGLLGNLTIQIQGILHLQKHSEKPKKFIYSYISILFYNLGFVTPNIFLFDV